MSKERRSTGFKDATRWEELNKKQQEHHCSESQKVLAINRQEPFLSWKGWEVFEGDWVLTHGCICEVLYGKFECDTDIDQHNSGWTYTMTFIGWHVRPLKKQEYHSGDTYAFDPDDCKVIHRNFVK